MAAGGNSGSCPVLATKDEACSGSEDDCRPSKRGARRRAAQASLEQALRNFAARAESAEMENARLIAIIEALQGDAPSSSLSHRLQAMAVALQAQEEAAFAGRPSRSPRALLSPKAHLKQVAAKHLFTLEGEAPWHELPNTLLKKKLRGQPVKVCLDVACTSLAEFQDRECSSGFSEFDSSGADALRSASFGVCSPGQPVGKDDKYLETENSGNDRELASGSPSTRSFADASLFLWSSLCGTLRGWFGCVFYLAGFAVHVFLYSVQQFLRLRQSLRSWRDWRKVWKFTAPRHSSTSSSGISVSRQRLRGKGKGLGLGKTRSDDAQLHDVALCMTAAAGRAGRWRRPGTTHHLRVFDELDLASS
jgi:hypothetical protein